MTVATGRHHVLLVGIDAYDHAGKLNGCVNDIDAIQRVLIQRVGISPDRIKRLVAPRTGAVHDSDVTSHLPTLANLHTALDELAGEHVAADDRVFIYYAGHGTQCPIDAGEGRRFTREALLPMDDRQGPVRRYLFDWDLNSRIARIAAKAQAVTFILDCCSA